MTMQRLGIIALATIVMLASQQIVTAQTPHGTPHTPDPERVANRCIHVIFTLARRCDSANTETAHGCIRRINELLAHGEYDEARHVAHHCIQEIEHRSNACVDQIRRHCRHCVHLLLRLHAREQAFRVYSACQHAVSIVRHSQQRTTNAIRSQFDGHHGA